MSNDIQITTRPAAEIVSGNNRAARRLGCCASHFSRCVRGLSAASPELAARAARLGITFPRVTAGRGKSKRMKKQH
jgi:hypothetical protein